MSIKECWLRLLDTLLISVALYAPYIPPPVSLCSFFQLRLFNLARRRHNKLVLIIMSFSGLANSFCPSTFNFALPGRHKRVFHLPAALKRSICLTCGSAAALIFQIQLVIEAYLIWLLCSTILLRPPCVDSENNFSRNLIQNHLLNPKTGCHKTLPEKINIGLPVLGHKCCNYSAIGGLAITCRARLASVCNFADWTSIMPIIWCAFSPDWCLTAGSVP